MHTRVITAFLLALLLGATSLASVTIEGLGELSNETLLEMLLTGDPDDENASLPDEHLSQALASFESAHGAHPKDGRWAAGIALVLLRQGEEDDAYTWAKKAVKLSPKNADAHYAKGTVAGRKTESAGMFAKLGLANTCKDSFHKAVKLDPNHYASRVGLVMYYTFAPGIAGGSWSKAFDQAEAITRIPGRESDGHALAALVASQKGD